MRVYEFSKESGMSSREILEVLRGAGFEVVSHMSVLDQKCVDFLNKLDVRPKGAPSQGLVDDAGVAPVVEVRRMALDELATELGLPATEIILMLLKKGIVCAKNQPLAATVVRDVAEHYGAVVVERSAPTAFEGVKKERVLGPQNERAAIVVVLGHVDHGKTTFLDFVRRTRVAAKEAGGITQRLGAYSVKTDLGNLVFLDTPGHEAFSVMRTRGAHVADIAVLMVAADDGIKPQTLEAIRIARTANIPIVVAINKVDKVDAARLEEIKKQLALQDLLPEEWGGTIICAPISAKTGQGVADLLEILVIKAHEMELRADYSATSAGFVLESYLEKGRGAVATYIGQHGTLHIGDYFVCGDVCGRVSALVDELGVKHKSVAPGVPIRIIGFAELPHAGDYLRVVSAEEYKVFRAGVTKKSTSYVQRNQSIAPEAIRVLVKADSDTSKDVLFNSIIAVGEKNNGVVSVVHAGVGDINESDIELASTMGAIIYGFGVKVDARAQALAKKKSISTRLYAIIYQLLDDVALLVESKKVAEIIRTKIGEAIILKVFNIKGSGIVAGADVKKGKFIKGSIAVVTRDGVIVGEGKIRSLQREKRAVKEVAAGFDCAFVVDGFEAWQEGDNVACFTETTAP